MSKPFLFLPYAALFALFLSPLLAVSQQPESDSRKIINLWRPGDPGQRLYIDGRVLDESGSAIANATIRIRQADGNGSYHDDRYRGTCTTGQDGGYAFGTVLPGQYASVKHIHIFVTHDNYAPLRTEILFKGDPNLDEERDRTQAIFLEEAQSKGEKILFGRFDITLKAGTE